MPSFKAAITLLLITALLSSRAVYAIDESKCPNQWTDPATDTCNPLRYIPNLALNCVAAAIYFILGAILSFWAIRRRARYFLCLPIACWFEGVGFVIRIIFRQNVHRIFTYAIANLLVILPPCAFLAADYVLLGRLVVYLDAGHCIRPLNARLVSRVFILSDVVTFFIQAGGGGLSSVGSFANIGSKIFLVGIAAQLVSFCAFTVLYIVFGIRAHKEKAIWTRPNWKPLYFAMAPTCVFFIIRSVYRTIELSQGYIGYLATHESFLLGLDSLPLILGVSVYCWFWPARYIQFEGNPFKDPQARAGSEAVEQVYPLRMYESEEDQREVYKPYGHQDNHFATSR
ncbi:hypothetical protein IAR50_000444 [Cryptococcus sp. DSM 104548]